MGDYKYIVIPIIAWAVAQIIKTIIEIIKGDDVSIIRMLMGSGGMPSSHSSLVVSLLVLILINFGIDSPYFAICFVFGSIVLYDAMNVRYEAGEQAKVINKMLVKEKNMVKLKEQLGHKPIEVLGGIIVGIVVALIGNMIL